MRQKKGDSAKFLYFNNEIYIMQILKMYGYFSHFTCFCSILYNCIGCMSLHTQLPTMTILGIVMLVLHFETATIHQMQI